MWPPVEVPSLQLFGHGALFDVSTTLFVIFILSRPLKLFNGLRAVSNLPGYRVPFQPIALPGALFPTSWWNPGRYFHWDWRLTLYKDRPHETFSIIPFLMGVPSVCTSNLEVMRQVVMGDQKTSFKKSETVNKMLLKWGMNLVAAPDGEVWRKHRRVVGPAFSNKLYKLVWAETLNTYRQMEIAEGWVGKHIVEIPAVQKITAKLALLVMGRCGFGFSFDWSAPPIATDGKMAVQEALRVIADSPIAALLLPNWVRYLPLPGFNRIREAFVQLTSFMWREIEARTFEVKSESENVEGRKDAFTMLIRANDQETGKLKLNDQEVIGNVFILLFAGHETTSHTLSATLALLSLHQDIQEEILQEIISVIGYERDPTFEDYPKLEKVLAAFYEALRLFPAAHIRIREAAQDVVLQLPNPVGQEGTTPLAIQKGTIVILDMVGIQYNPRYFDDPESYRPSRWYGATNEPETFPAFGIGPRTCVGRKFATTEAVAFLTVLLRDWRVEPALKRGETRDAWKVRVLARPVLGITMGVREAPVRLVRRSPAREI